MFDVISIGSSLVDIFLNVPQVKLKPGDKIELEMMRMISGGGGTNTAVGFARAGFKAAVMSETGQDNVASVILTELQRENVDTSLIVREKLEQTGGSVILVGDDGSRTALIHRGASSMLDVYDISPFWLTKAKWVHLSNIAGREDALRKIFELIRKDPDTVLSWNPGKKELAMIADGTIAVADIPCKVLIVNTQEWEMVKAQQDQLVKEIPEIVVTAGKDGGFAYVDGKKSLKFFGTQVPSVDDTGAGDAFCTGYVVGQLLRQPPEKCIEYGVRNAGSVISYWGAKAGLLDRQRLTHV